MEFDERMNELIAGITSPWIMCIILFIIPSIILWRQKNKKVLKQLWLSIIATGIIAVLIKFIVQRQRPFEPEYFFGSIPDYSFPSLQTAVAFAAIPFLWNMFQAPKYWSVLRRKARILFVSYAVIIMWSRVILQEHYASDVIVGALIGIGIGTIIQKIIK